MPKPTRRKQAIKRQSFNQSSSDMFVKPVVVTAVNGRVKFWATWTGVKQFMTFSSASHLTLDSNLCHPQRRLSYHDLTLTLERFSRPFIKFLLTRIGFIKGFLFFSLLFANIQYWMGLAHVPLTCNLFSLHCPKFEETFSGFVKPGYEKVEKAFQQNFLDGWEVGASFSAYVNNEHVVELYGGYHDYDYKRPYTNQSLQLVFSSSKVMEGVVLTHLVDQGLVHWDTVISHIWPEFGQGGKENVTLACLLTHRAGVSYLDQGPSLEHLYDLDKMAEILAMQPHNFKGQRIQGYHAVTRGWYLNELVRRIDPLKRTMGMIIKQDIMPLLNIEFYWGLPEHLEERVSLLVQYPMLRSIARYVLEPISPILHSLLFQPHSITSKSLIASSPKQHVSFPHTHNKKEIWHTEGPSYSGITNAKSLSRIAAMMSNFGTLEGISFMRSETILEAMKTMPPELDAVLKRNLTFSLGGWGAHIRFKGSEEVEWLGWGGTGGSMVFWNPELNIAFSYTMNSIGMTSMGDRRSWRIIKALLDSFNDMTSKK